MDFPRKYEFVDREGSKAWQGNSMNTNMDVSESYIEFWPIDHPAEPPEEDRPVDCPSASTLVGIDKRFCRSIGRNSVDIPTGTAGSFGRNSVDLSTGTARSFGRKSVDIPSGTARSFWRKSVDLPAGTARSFWRKSVDLPAGTPRKRPHIVRGDNTK